MLGSPAPELLNINPLVAVLDEVLSPAECTAIITVGQGRMQRATVIDARGEGVESDGRTNSHCELPSTEFPQVLPMLMKIGMALRMPIQHAEGPTLLHYAESQEFRPHFDGIALDFVDGGADRFERRGGQRLFSTMVYLNDVDDGGGTAFPALGITVPPRQGRLLTFANTMAGLRERAELSIHAGEPVLAGEKWVVIAFWRERPASCDFSETDQT